MMMLILGGAHHCYPSSSSSRRGGFLSSNNPMVSAGVTTAGDGGAGKEKGKETAFVTASPLSHHHCAITVRASRLPPSFLPSASGMSMAATDSTAADAEEPNEPQVAKGYTLTQFCDKMIDNFLHDNPRPKDWRRLLIFRDEWKRYNQAFYARCKVRADAEDNSLMKRKLVELERKVRRIDNEMERHFELLDEIQNNPTDINAIVARRRKDFTGDFFHHLSILSQVNDTLEDRDAITRLGAKCLSAVSAYDNAAENVEMLDNAQSKLDDILNSPSLDVACEKIRSLAKAKELDSALVLLINRSWAAAKDSPTMKSPVKDIMYHIYKTTKSSLRSIAPKEIKLLKYLLNITDPEERFSALASAFSPRNEHEIKDKEFLCSTPEELHKWIKIMLDAYQLNKEETELKEARNMTDPVVIQRLFILKETIEEEYFKRKLRGEASKELEPED